MEDLIKNKIDSYRLGSNHRPLIFDINNIDDILDLNSSYALLKKVNFLELVSDKNEFPTLESLYEFLDNCTNEVCFIFGLSDYLLLFGECQLRNTIHLILSKTYKTKFIIVTYQCSKYLDEKTPKYRDNIIINKSEIISIKPLLVFMPEGFNNYVSSVKGLNNALLKIEKQNDGCIYVSTMFKKEDFPNSLIPINECNSSFDLLSLIDIKTKKLNVNYGSEENWKKLLENIKNNSIEDTINCYVKTNDILGEIKEWFDKSNFEQWVLFIYLKLYVIKTNNWSVNFSIFQSKTVDDFIKNIYRSILEINYNDSSYWSRYESWKKITSELKDENEIYNYCNYVTIKEDKAIYYLTDNTDCEKLLIIKLLDKYRDFYDKRKLLNILKFVYIDLYYYLSDYDFNNEYFNKYFNDYKYLKATNILTLEFKEMVDKEAVERSFKKYLKCRSEVLDEIKFENSCVLFIDALGVEFINYIEQKCKEKKLVCKSHIARSNLPSITSENIEFRDYFEAKGIDLVDEKRLDNLKHDGHDDYDYDKNKLPTHIIEELKIINEAIEHIYRKIKSQKYKKFVIVSDHGATRLAILNTEMIKEDLGSTGEHGGRVCRVVDEMEVIPNSIIERDYCILADYNAFKGGRVGKIEMHGGATLEEVTVPIIEIFEKARNVEILVKDPIISVSNKKIGILRIYSSVNLNNVKIIINGKEYEAIKDDKLDNIYNVELKDIRKSGEYYFDVYEKDELISQNNEFTIENAVVKEIDMWG